MCLATPGSGKTRLSAELAKSLLQANKIDFVLTFAPSIEVAQNTSNTFTKVLGRRFDGQIGAIGVAYTYQSLLFIQADFWQIFDSHRVLVVLDEVHHCAGSDLSNSNSWGGQVLLRIQSKATFSIALVVRLGEVMTCQSYLPNTLILKARFAVIMSMVWPRQSKMEFAAIQSWSSLITIVFS